MVDATFSTRPNLRIRADVTLQSQNQPGNFSTFLVQLYLVETAQQSSFSAIAGDNGWAMNVNGVGYGGNFTFDARPAGLQAWTLLYTTINIYHYADGTLPTLTWSASASSAVLGGAGIGATGFSAPRIPKVASAPTLNSLSTAGLPAGQVQTNFSGSVDHGGSAVSSYLIQWAWDAGFTTGVGSMNTVYGNQIVTGLTAGKIHFFRVLAVNGVGNSAWSAALSIRVGIGGKKWDGSVESSFATAVRWDGTVEVPLSIAVRWDGTAEVPIAG